MRVRHVTALQTSAIGRMAHRPNLAIVIAQAVGTSYAQDRIHDVMCESSMESNTWKHERRERQRPDRYDDKAGRGELTHTRAHMHGHTRTYIDRYTRTI